MREETINIDEAPEGIEFGAPLSDDYIEQWTNELIEIQKRRRYSFADHQDKLERFAVYPESGTGRGEALSYCGLGLGGETGEVLEHLKKIQRDNGGEVSPERREALSKELGDVLWYLTRLATELRLDLGEIALQNVEKLEDRLERNVIHGDGDNR